MERSEDIANPHQEASENPQVVFSWTAPLRPYKKRSKLILRFYLAVTLLLSSIIFFFGDKVLLLPIWAILFLFYTLTITPPPDIENKITEFGIETANMPFRWESLSHFYFSKRFGFTILTIVTHPPHNYHLFLVVPTEDIRDHLRAILSQHLLYVEKPRKGITEKVTDLLSSLVPNEED